jgi:hypothetical protein
MRERESESNYWGYCGFQHDSSATDNFEIVHQLFRDFRKACAFVRKAVYNAPMGFEVTMRLLRLIKTFK